MRFGTAACFRFISDSAAFPPHFGSLLILLVVESPDTFRLHFLCLPDSLSSHDHRYLPLAAVQETEFLKPLCPSVFAFLQFSLKEICSPRFFRQPPLLPSASFDFVS